MFRFNWIPVAIFTIWRATGLIPHSLTDALWFGIRFPYACAYALNRYSDQVGGFGCPLPPQRHTQVLAVGCYTLNKWAVHSRFCAPFGTQLCSKVLYTDGIELIKFSPSKTLLRSAPWFIVPPSDAIALLEVADISACIPQIIPHFAFLMRACDRHRLH